MRQERTPIGEQAKGKWAAILPSLGVSADFLTGRHGPCPMCGGKDRFRFDDKGRGMYYCSGCGAGDGVKLVMGVNSWDFRQAAKEIEALVATAPVTMIRSGPDQAQVRAEMEQLWKNALPLHMVDEVADWWLNRIGRVPTLSAVRATPALRCPGDGVYPAMLSIVQGVDGKAANLHRTFIAQGGVKAPVDEPRRVMALPMPKGCAIRLAPYTDVLGIAEGIETAVAASLLFDVPVWASLNTALMEGWEPPEGVRVIVFGDNDKNYAGQAAAYSLAKKLIVKKREVEVRLPPTPGMDWNDVWLSAGKEPAKAANAA